MQEQMHENHTCIFRPFDTFFRQKKKKNRKKQFKLLKSTNSKNTTSILGSGSVKEKDEREALDDKFEWSARVVDLKM